MAMFPPMSNIQLFDEFAAEILADLYESFPVRIPLNALKLTGDGVPNRCDRSRNGSGQPLLRREVCLATIDWLVGEGYIVAGDRGQHGPLDCVLSAKGLTLLRSAPKTLKGKEAVGERLVSAFRAEAPQLATEVVRSALIAGAG